MCGSICVYPSLSIYVCFPVSVSQKCLRLDPELPVWTSKQRVLVTLTQSLSDVLNYGLFQPAFNGRAGKFLDEERLLKEYPLPPITPIPYLEVQYCHIDVFRYACFMMVFFFLERYKKYWGMPFVKNTFQLSLISTLCFVVSI